MRTDALGAHNQAIYNDIQHSLCDYYSKSERTNGRTKNNRGIEPAYTHLNERQSMPKPNMYDVKLLMNTKSLRLIR